MPPVLDVAFDELSAGGSQHVLSREVWAREGEGHHVLQLIAKAERAAWLVVTGSSPETTAHGLVEKPSVHQHVEGVIRRVDMNGVETAVPARLCCVQRGDGVVDVAVALDQGPGVMSVITLTQQE
jgi:hypothetical protein